MPRVRDEPIARRSVVPDAGDRSLWFAAVWTGVGAAVACAVAALIAVAVCWLPVSGNAHGSHTASVVHAGLLTFLAALHGGITVAGSHATWLPLGMTLLVGLAAWRAGAGLADAAAEADENDPRRLVRAVCVQAVAFTAAAVIAVPFARLGTSSVSYLAAAVGGLVVSGAGGGTAFVLASPLRDQVARRVPRNVTAAARAATGGLLVYLTGGALLTAAALVLQHDRVQALTAEVGTGWGGVPVLLLGILAAPNAVLAGTAYLSGPGFAVGSGTDVHLFTAAHGTLPAFPLLGALPTGNGAAAAPVAAALATVLLAGIVTAALAARCSTWLDRISVALGAAVLCGAALFVLAAVTGGSIGAGRLRTVGASPWQLGAAGLAELLAVSLASLGALAAWRWVRDPVDSDDEVGFLLTPRRRSWSDGVADDVADVEVDDEADVMDDDEVDDDEDDADGESASPELEVVADASPAPDEPKVRRLAG